MSGSGPGPLWVGWKVFENRFILTEVESWLRVKRAGDPFVFGVIYGGRGIPNRHKK